MDGRPAPLVLLGGSGLGGWIWERVTPLLEAAGHRVVTPRLRGIDGDPTPAAEVTLTSWVDDVVAALETVETDDASGAESAGEGPDLGSPGVESAAQGPPGPEGVTIVAHSFAAFIVAGVLARQRASTPPPATSERISARTPATSEGIPAPRTTPVRSVVMIDAVLPTPGRSWFDQQGPGASEVMPLLAVDGATPWFTRQEIDALFPGHGLTDDDYAWMAERVSGQPLGTYAEPAADLELTDAGFDLGYVRCLRTDPPTSHVTAESPGWRYREIDAGHWPMVTAPDETARVILDLVQSQGLSRE
ncbi:alpha/beta fold hydrolase [Georgenia sp. Z1344]|uniref:alpha/beta fold hydrolase n=1 Tax=Georgenia sp. Z1344 TaxID=3416706 RepID=UPI003CEDCEAF